VGNHCAVSVKPCPKEKNGGNNPGCTDTIPSSG
jgi:hypothetical protein